MDEDLRDAALSGNVEYLRKCVETNKPIEYYLTYYYPQSSSAKGDHLCHGNIFHMAAHNNREEFLREAIRMLPSENTQQLLLQPRQPYNGNPLHVAAAVGNVEIVKMLLDVYRCLPTLPSDHSKRPWLHKDDSIYGYTPCYAAIAKYHEDCALEILRMDTGLLSNIASNRGAHLIYEAILHKFTKLALEIVRAPHSISCTGPMGLSSISAIFVLNYSKEAEEIFRRLLQREPGLIEQRNDDGFSVFYQWVKDGEMWLFECLLKCHDIIPNVKAVFVNLVSSTDKYGDNPLHNLAEYTSNEELSIEIAKLFIDIYKQESPNISEDVLPWLVQNIFKDTPLSLAISRRYEKFAVYILSVDENAVIKNQKNVLFLAIEKGCHEVAEKILEVIEKQGWTHLLYNDKKNALHLAPLCKKDLCTRLIEGHPELLEGGEKGGITVVHNWVKSGEVWLFEYVLKSKWRSSFVKLLVSIDYNTWNNPFHVAAMITTNEAINQIIKLLVDAYKEDFPYWSANSVDMHPWFITNKAEQGPLHLAILNQREELALYILSLHEKPFINELLDIYEPHHTVLFLAIQNNCRRVAEYILLRLDKQSWTNYLKDSSDGRNILHLATTLEDKEFGKWLVNEAPEYITDQDNNEQSPWDKAYEIGSSWFIEASLKKDPSVFDRAPLAWTKACENGHVSTLYAFIDHNPGAFRDLCIEHKDSPLHHIQLPSLTKYEEFLKISRMKDLINLQDSQGETPLHISIQNRNKPLTETLLSMEKIVYSIKNKDQKTAVDLLAQVCEEDNTWEEMCQRIGFDPWIKTSYFQHKTNLFEVRNSLFVVAALLATITFTAGFTLPGGLNQETGEALLAKKVAFLVFLMSNTLAMCTSMLVLICLVWSMVVQDSSNKSLMLIDRSMWLLMVAFYSTLLAFMTGVFTVISPKVLWAAIIVILMCSLIGISANRTLLYKVLFISSPKKKPNQRDPMHLLELGNAFPCCQGSRSQKDK